MSKLAKEINIRVVYSSSDPYCLLARVGIESFKRYTSANIKVTEERFQDKTSDSRPRMYVDCDNGEHALKVTGICNIFGLLSRLTQGSPGL